MKLTQTTRTCDQCIWAYFSAEVVRLFKQIICTTKDVPRGFTFQESTSIFETATFFAAREKQVDSTEVKELRLNTKYLRVYGDFIKLHLCATEDGYTICFPEDNFKYHDGELYSFTICFSFFE